MAPPSMSWATIAPELLLAILECEHSPDPRATLKLLRAHKDLLLQCSLVSRHWADCAQSLLFQHVLVPKHVHRPDFDYRQRFDALVRTLAQTALRKPYLNDAVRKLSVQIGDHLHTDHDICAHVDTHLAARAVSLCPNLRHFDIRVREGNRHSFTGDDLALLRMAPLVTHLSIVADNSLILPQLLHVWPLLASLDTGTSLFQMPPGWAAALPPACALKEYQACGRFADIENIAAPFAPSLRKLTVVSHQRSASPLASPPALPLVERLEHLESAVLDCEFNGDTLRTLPATVQHLGLIFWDPALFSVLARFLCESAHCLRSLSLLGSRAAREAGALKELCRQRGIAVRFLPREELVASPSRW